MTVRHTQVAVLLAQLVLAGVALAKDGPLSFNLKNAGMVFPGGKAPVPLAKVVGPTNNLGQAKQLRDGSVELTPPEKVKAGWALRSKAVDISKGFNTSFTLQFNPCPGDPADGMTFVLLKGSRVPDLSKSPRFKDVFLAEGRGYHGSDLGLQFKPPFVAVGMSTWRDPGFDRIYLFDDYPATTIDEMEKIFSLTSYPAADSNATMGFSALAGKPLYYWVDWAPSVTGLFGRQAVLSVFFSKKAIKPQKPVITYNINLVSRLGKQAILGFTAGTGESCQQNLVKNWSFTAPLKP